MTQCIPPWMAEIATEAAQKELGKEWSKKRFRVRMFLRAMEMRDKPSKPVNKKQAQSQKQTSEKA